MRPCSKTRILEHRSPSRYSFGMKLWISSGPRRWTVVATIRLAQRWDDDGGAGVRADIAERLRDVDCMPQLCCVQGLFFEGTFSPRGWA